jgi:serine/threonine-protein kinase RsbW
MSVNQDDPVRTDILRLFRANPMLRDTSTGIASRVGRAEENVRAALAEMEAGGLAASRWVGGVLLYFFTGAPGDGAVPTPAAKPDSPGEMVAPSRLVARLRVPSTVEGIHIAREALSGMARSAGMEPGSLMEFNVALSEALTNAYRYGRRGDAQDRITVDVKANDAAVEVRVRDRGSGFPSMLVGAAKNDMKSTGGRGILLMRNLTDQMDIKRHTGGTVVTLVKSLRAPAPPAAAGVENKEAAEPAPPHTEPREGARNGSRDEPRE